MTVVISGDSGITTPDLTDTSLTSGRVVYAGTSGNLTGSASLVFDGTNLGVLSGSVTTPAAKLHVVGGVRSSNGAGTIFSTLNSDGIYASGTDLYLVAPTGYSNIFYANNVERMRLPVAGGLKTSTTISVGNATPSTSGAGITFPASQDASSNANTLDDYEEGTWTPSYSGGLSGVTYGTVRNGFYTKIGNQVTVWFGIMTEGLTVTSSSLNISGLPFTSKSSLGAFNTVSLASAVRWVSSPPIVGEIPLNSTTISLYSNFNLTGGGTDPTLVTTSNMATGSGNRNVVYGTATYTV